MGRSISLGIIIAIICFLTVGAVWADRLILIPTGTSLATGIKVDYANNPGKQGGSIYWVNIGVSRVEIEGVRFQNFGVKRIDTYSAQLAVLPETSFTPAISIGARDIANRTDDRGLLYDGRSFYIAASKGVPITGGIPILLQEVKLHVGFGTGSLNGIFFGAEGTLPLGIHIRGEYDSKNFNFAASYNIIPLLSASVSSIKGDIYYGGLFKASF
jgi:hypothetical protein